MAVNVFTFQPGAKLPFVECHVMEHGLYMMQGQGVYCLSENWYPVAAGDTIWMASYCPQWFVAMGSCTRGLYLLQRRPPRPTRGDVEERRLESRGATTSRHRRPDE